MLFVITPIQNNSNKQQKDDFEFSPRADSGIHSPASSIQQSPRGRKSSPYENRALFHLPELQSHNPLMTPMPGNTPELTNPIRDSQPNSNTPPNLTSATDKGKKNPEKDTRTKQSLPKSMQPSHTKNNYDDRRTELKHKKT